MTEAIIVALITASASVICQVIISAKQKKDNEVKLAVKEKEIYDRLSHIEEKLDIHNGYADKLGDVAIALAKMSKDIEYLKEARS